MLSVFPDLLAFSMIATTLLRVSAGYVLCLLGVQFVRASRQTAPRARLFAIAFAVLHLAVGLLLIAGLYTQIAALLGTLLALIAYFSTPHKAHKKSGLGQNHLFFLLFVLCLSLLFLGPGAWAVDVPV